MTGWRFVVVIVIAWLLMTVGYFIKHPLQ
jgi:hypothetical protein